MKEIHQMNYFVGAFHYLVDILMISIFMFLGSCRNCLQYFPLLTWFLTMDRNCHFLLRTTCSRYDDVVKTKNGLVKFFRYWLCSHIPNICKLQCGLWYQWLRISGDFFSFYQLFSSANHAAYKSSRRILLGSIPE